MKSNNLVEIAASADTKLEPPRNDVGVERLLDVISSIIADDYIETVKKNPEVFGIASPPSADRNDERS